MRELPNQTNQLGSQASPLVGEKSVHIQIGDLSAVQIAGGGHAEKKSSNDRIRVSRGRWIGMVHNPYSLTLLPSTEQSQKTAARTPEN
jgi:hypothetical protein